MSESMWQCWHVSQLLVQVIAVFRLQNLSKYFNEDPMYKSYLRDTNSSTNHSTNLALAFCTQFCLSAAAFCFFSPNKMKWTCVGFSACNQPVSASSEVINYQRLKRNIQCTNGKKFCVCAAVCVCVNFHPPQQQKDRNKEKQIIFCGKWTSFKWIEWNEMDHICLFIYFVLCVYVLSPVEKPTHFTSWASIRWRCIDAIESVEGFKTLSPFFICCSLSLFQLKTFFL